MSTIEEQLKALREETLASLKQITAENEKEMQELRVSVLGKKGSLTEILKGMKDVSAEMRPVIGKHVNEARDVLTAAFEETAKLLEEKKVAAQLASESIDVTLPGRPVAVGHRHVLTQTSEEIEDIFIGMGYQVVDGFEVEQDYYNFERMNLPKDHPARDMQDTFYITEELLLRTHTSPVQARAMDAHDFSKGPLKMKSVKFVCVHLISHSQSHLLRWMFLASSVVEKAVTYVRKQVGSKSWVLVWSTHVSLK